MNGTYNDKTSYLLYYNYNMEEINQLSHVMKQNYFI